MTTIHSEHPEWKDHHRFCNPKMYLFNDVYIPPKGISCVESHDEELMGGYGYVNKYIFTDKYYGDTLTIINSYGSKGFKKGKWEYFYTDNKKGNEHTFEGYGDKTKVLHILATFIQNAASPARNE